MSQPAIPDEESLFPRPKDCPKDWRQGQHRGTPSGRPGPIARASSDERRAKAESAEPAAKPAESPAPEPPKVEAPAPRKPASAPRIAAAPTPAPSRVEGPAPRGSGFARNLLRVAAVAGAIGGIALLAQDRKPTPAPRSALADVPLGSAPATAPTPHAATPVVALEKPAAAAKPAVAATPETSKPAQPAVAEKPRVSGPKKSLRELAKRSAHHEAIARILLQLDPTHPDERSTLEAVCEITNLGPPAVPALREMVVEIDEDSDRRVLAQALANVKDDTAADAAGEALSLVEDQPAQVSILHGLPETPGSNDSIATAFSVEKNNETRMLLLKEYTRRIGMNPDEAPPELPVAVSEFDVDAFLRVASADSDPAIRRETLRMVEERAAPRDMNLAEDVYKSATDPSTKKAALLALGATGGEAALPLLLELAQSPDSKVRYDAVEAISRARCDKALEAMANIVKNDSEAKIRKHAQRLLAKMKDES